MGNIIMRNAVISSALVLLASLSKGICNRMSCSVRSNKKHEHGGNEGHLLMTKQTE
jgi:hypothetical protein